MFGVLLFFIKSELSRTSIGANDYAIAYSCRDLIIRLNNTAVEASKPALRDLAGSNPLAVVQIAGVLMQEFASVLDIKVKKQMPWLRH